MFQAVDPMIVRFCIVNHHYRSPLDFSYVDLESEEKAYRRLCKSFATKVCTTKFSDDHAQASPIVQRMKEFMDDDLNTVGMWGVVFENLDDLGDELCSVKGFIQDILGLNLEDLPEKIVCITPEIQKLLNERKEARVQKNWARSDELRDQLKELAVDVHDSKLSE